MTILEIIKQAIDTAGADGFANTDQECGCAKDDLGPCDAFRGECELARCRPGIPGSDWDFIMIPLDKVAAYDKARADEVEP